jgi:hypothetical protein
MNEHVCAVLALNKSKSLGGVKPLYGALLLRFHGSSLLSMKAISTPVDRMRDSGKNRWRQLMVRSDDAQSVNAF